MHNQASKCLHSIPVTCHTGLEALACTEWMSMSGLMERAARLVAIAAITSTSWTKIFQTVSPSIWSVQLAYTSVVASLRISHRWGKTPVTASSCFLGNSIYGNSFFRVLRYTWLTNVLFPKIRTHVSEISYTLNLKNQDNCLICDREAEWVRVIFWRSTVPTT